MRRKLSLSDGFPIGGGVLIDGSLLNPCLGW